MFSIHFYIFDLTPHTLFIDLTNLFVYFQLPDVEVKDIPGEQFKFDLCQRNSPLSIILTAHKEHVKTNWLAEIRQHASDVGNYSNFN